MAEQAGIPGKGWYWAAGAIAIASTIAVGALIAWFILMLDTGAQFLAPGRHTAELARPGNYVVWNEYRTVFDGRSYDSSEKLPAGVCISVLDTASGQPLTVGAGLGARSSTGATERVSVARFTIEKPGRYEIVVDGAFEPRVFSAGPDIVPRLLGVIFGAIALVFFGYGAAIGIAAWAYIGRDTAGGPAPGAQAGAAPAEPSVKRLTAVIYGLQIASFFVGITFLAAIIINYLKRKDVEGTWLESHFRWQIRTFWFGLLWLVIGIATLIVLVGFLVLTASAAWVLYRAIKGWLALEDGKPVGA